MLLAFTYYLSSGPSASVCSDLSQVGNQVIKHSSQFLHHCCDSLEEVTIADCRNYFVVSLLVDRRGKAKRQWQGALSILFLLEGSSSFYFSFKAWWPLGGGGGADKTFYASSGMSHWSFL